MGRCEISWTELMPAQTNCIGSFKACEIEKLEYTAVSVEFPKFSMACAIATAVELAPF